MLRRSAAGIVGVVLCSACISIPVPPSDPPPLGSATDIDGNYYPTVVIGRQEWMAVNLKTTRYNDGTPIANVTDTAAWNNLSGAYSWYDNDIANKDLYGALYNWHVIQYLEVRGRTDDICPPGFYLPEHEPWGALTNALGGSVVAGGALKEAGTSHWDPPNTGATNRSGFTALPAGYRDSAGNFIGKGQSAIWWCSDQDLLTFASWFWDLEDTNTLSAGAISPWEFGYSIRCMRAVTPN
jgi:uncharacterized protein (TIGR02145 family)